MKKYWFFDLDGTLADTDPDIRLAWKAALEDLGLKCPNFDAEFVAGPTIEEMAAKLLPGVYTDEIGKRLRESFGEHYDHGGFPQTKEYEGVLDMVRGLKARGARVFIATNKRLAGARLMAEHFGWNNVFERLYTGDMFYERGMGQKMNKQDLLAFMMRSLCVKSEDCVMVGDTAGDIAAAKANGISSVFVSWGYGDAETDSTGATYVIDTPGIPAPLLAEARIVIGKDREGSVRRRHPWLFTGAITNLDSIRKYAGIAVVETAKGAPLGWGYVNPKSQIRVRMLSFKAADYPDEEYLRGLVSRAIALRAPLMRRGEFAAARLINAESDGLPGVVVDCYAGYAVMQITSAFAERFRSVIAGAVMASEFVKGVSARDDVDAREKEGLDIGGFTTLAGETPPDAVLIEENGVKYLVDVRKGHKTGFYLDQREARRRVGERASGEVLNAFSYTGGFGLVAAVNGAAHVTQVDVSGEALRRAEEIAALNGVPEGKIDYVEDDVFKFLRLCRDSGRAFDTIILDPPKFADAKSYVARAARGYKDINLIAMKLLRPGGILATFSCSGAMTSDLFDKIVADAAVDAKANMQILERTSAAEDHCVSALFPEGHYLKGLILRKV